MQAEGEEHQRAEHQDGDSQRFHGGPTFRVNENYYNIANPDARQGLCCHYLFR
jgi:hypothetical protein